MANRIVIDPPDNVPGVYVQFNKKSLVKLPVQFLSTKKPGEELLPKNDYMSGSYKTFTEE